MEKDDALSCVGNPSICLSNVIYAFTVGLGGGLAYVGGFMLDTAVSLSLNSAAYALSFLSSGWTTARDLANMAFILILVYIAFTIMFQAETAGTIRMLAWVIFIALIINFSFFFTRVVIDVGNILAVQFYNSIDAPTMQSSVNATSGNTGALANTATGIANKLTPDGVLANTKDLTASIMQALNIQQLFSNDSFKSFASQSGFGTKFIVLSFLYITIGACYFILAAMFFAVAVKFIVRIVVLWFLIIASPLAFVCKAVPNKPEISGWYDKWQHELVTHAFYPAFFLFIFFFIYTVLSGLAANGGILGGLATDLNSLASTANNGTPILIMSMVANIGIRLGFVIAMLYIALKASEYMGVKGGELAHSVTGWATRTGTSMAFGGAGAALRSTIGAGGYALGQSNMVRGAAKTAPGRLLQNTLLGVGRKSFDARGAPGVRKGLGVLGIDTKEAGGKGGYEAAVAARVAKREKQSKLLKPSDYQLDEAYKAEVSKLGGEQRTMLEKANKELIDTQDARTKGEATADDVKRAKAKFKNALEATKDENGDTVIDRAKKRAGNDLSKEFIKNLDVRGPHNLWGVASSGIPGWISRRDKEAAAKLRDSKNDEGRLKTVLGRVKSDGKDSKDAEEKWFSKNANKYVPKKRTVGDYEFEIGGKAYWQDTNDKEKQYEIVDIVDDKAYLKGIKDPVDLDTLYEEKGQARRPQQAQQQAQQNNTVAQAATTGAVLATAVTGTQQQGGGQQRGGSSNAPASGGPRPGSIIPPSDVAPNRLTDEERAARFAPNPPRGGTPPPFSPLPFSPRPMGPTSSISSGPNTPPQPPPPNTTGGSTPPPSGGSTPPAPRGPSTPPPPPPPTTPSSPSGGTPPPPPPGTPPAPTSPASTFADLSPEEKGLAEHWTNQGISPADAIQTVKYMREGEAAGETLSRIPETQKLNEEFPKITTELAEQMKGLREEVANLKGAVAKSAPQSFVKPSTQQPSWTPKPPEASFSDKQKNQIKGLITDAVDDMDRKYAAMGDHDKWLVGEAKRILDNRGPNDHITTTEPPPAPPPPPRQTPEDTKRE